MLLGHKWFVPFLFFSRALTELGQRPLINNRRRGCVVVSALDVRSKGQRFEAWSWLTCVISLDNWVSSGLCILRRRYVQYNLWRRSTEGKQRKTVFAACLMSFPSAQALVLNSVTRLLRMFTDTSKVFNYRYFQSVQLQIFPKCSIADISNVFNCRYFQSVQLRIFPKCSIADISKVFNCGYFQSFQFKTILTIGRH